MRTQSGDPLCYQGAPGSTSAGNVDYSANANSRAYQIRARLHAPQTSEEISRAAQDLAAAGHSDHGIASILEANVNSIRQLLGEHEATK